MVKGHLMPPKWLHSKEESQQVKVINNYLLENEASSKYRLQQLKHASGAIARPIPRFNVGHDSKHQRRLLDTHKTLPHS